MKHQDSDKELAALYQQRKNQIAAPEIHFSSLQKNKRPRYSVVQLLSILFFGGAASFGILAVISHFSVQSTIPAYQTLDTKLSVVELDYEQVKPNDNVVAIVIPPLVPKKPYTAPAASKNENVLGVKSLPIDPTFSLPVDVVTVSKSPTVKLPKLLLVPIYQEQPKYSNKAVREKQSGTIKLAYNISPQGKVLNIITVESSQHRELNVSAKNALSKWRYRAGTYNKERYEIVFNFTLDQKK